MEALSIIRALVSFTFTYFASIVFLRRAECTKQEILFNFKVRYDHVPTVYEPSNSWVFR
jgi:hypothetical protein